MSQYSAELVARFKDNATPGPRHLAAEAGKADSRQLQKAAAVKLKHREMCNATARLGIYTGRQICREIRQTQAVYNRPAKSDMASQRELARVAQVTCSRVYELTAEINSGASCLQRIGSGVRTIGCGAAGMTADMAAGAYVLAQPVNRTMDLDTSLRRAVNTMYAGKSMAEKCAGVVETRRLVMDVAYVGGTTRDAALGAMNTMVASEAISDETVKKLLSTVMKTITTVNMEGNDVADTVTETLQTGLKRTDIPSLLDHASQPGVDGGFELRGMSCWLPRQLAAIGNVGMGATLDNLSDLLSVNQLSFMTAGNTDEAGNNLVNLLAKINSQDTVTKTKKITINGKEGFGFTASINKRQATDMNSLDVLVDTVGEITAEGKKSATLTEQIDAAQGGEAKLALLENQEALVDGTAIGRLVSGCQVLMALLVLVNNKQELTRLQTDRTSVAGAVDDVHGFVVEGSGFKRSQFSFAKLEVEYGAFEKFNDRIGDWMQSAAQWMRGHPEQVQTTMQVGYGAATASITVDTSSILGGGGLLSELFGGSNRALQTGRLMLSVSSLGPIALGAIPLAVIDGATYLTGQRDRRAEWSKPFARLSFWLEDILPNFSVGVRAEYLRKREEPGGNNAPLDSPVLKESMAQLDRSTQTNQQVSQQYVQAAAGNQTVTTQITGVAVRMTAAATQMQAVIGRLILIIVTA